jgi:hypothetical protein
MITILSTVISILAFRFRRRAAPRNAPAHPQLLLPRLIVTLDGNIAVVCCRPRSPLDEYFATHCIRKRRGCHNEHIDRRNVGQVVVQEATPSRRGVFGPPP